MEFKNLISPIYTQMKNSLNINNNNNNNNNSNNNSSNKSNMNNNNSNGKKSNNNNNTKDNDISNNNNSFTHDQLEDKHEIKSNKFISSPYQSQFEQQSQPLYSSNDSNSNNNRSSPPENNYEKDEYIPAVKKGSNKSKPQQAQQQVPSNFEGDDFDPIQAATLTQRVKSKNRDATPITSPLPSSSTKNTYSEDHENNTINYNTYGDNSYTQPYGNSPLYNNSTSNSTTSKKNNNSTNSSASSSNISNIIKSKPLPATPQNSKTSSSSRSDEKKNTTNEGLGLSSLPLSTTQKQQTNSKPNKQAQQQPQPTPPPPQETSKSSNKKSDFILEDDDEFDDFVEIEEQNINPICQQYYIPFYQSLEMCSNEAKKWLEDQWFLPANCKNIKWSKPNRFYFPIYVFSVTTTTFFNATFTINDFTSTISQQKITSNHDEIIFCASNSFDSTLVDKLIKKNTYSNRSTHLLPSSDELLVYSNTDTILNEKILTIDITKNEIWDRSVFPYIEEKEKKKCIEFVQQKYNVKNVELQMNDPLVDSEQYSLVYIPISSETYTYQDTLYDTLTSGNKGRTVGTRPIGTGLSVGGALYDAVSNLTTLVNDSIGM